MSKMQDATEDPEIEGYYQDLESEGDRVEEGSESGTCEICGEYYEKSAGESNLSRTGQCLKCGWNP